MQCLVYIGMPDNPQFLGAQDPAEVAKTINDRIGPSGENREYLFQLEQALLSLSADSGDEHVSDLARRVRAMPVVWRGEEAASSPAMLRRINSTEEQEEVEKSP